MKVTRDANLAIMGAWHTAIFALNGYAGKLKGKSLADFIHTAEGPRQRSTAADAASFFGALKSAGFPIEVERVTH